MSQGLVDCLNLALPFLAGAGLTLWVRLQSEKDIEAEHKREIKQLRMEIMRLEDELFNARLDAKTDQARDSLRGMIDRQAGTKHAADRLGGSAGAASDSE